MALTKRAKYLLYICIHFSAGMLAALLLESYRIRVFKGGGLYLVFLLVTPIAVIGYLVIGKFIDVFKQWQYWRRRKGRQPAVGKSR